MTNLPLSKDYILSTSSSIISMDCTCCKMQPHFDQITGKQIRLVGKYVGISVATLGVYDEKRSSVSPCASEMGRFLGSASVDNVSSG